MKFEKHSIYYKDHGSRIIDLDFINESQGENQNQASKYY